VEKIDAVLVNHPGLNAFLAKPLASRRLGGLTNTNWLVESPSGKFVLRVPGRGTEEYINRASEKQAASITSQLGVNAPLLYFDPTTGVQLSTFLEGAKTMDAESFKTKGAIERAARSFRRVHDSGQAFAGRFELFEMMENYLEVLKTKKATLPEGFVTTQQTAERVREALLRHPLPLVPCHCDPLAENFLDTGNQMFIVDWEYAGNNDPMWDLADLSVEAGFSPEQEQILLESYFQGTSVPAFDRGRVVLYKAMCDLLWTLWGMLQHANQNPADDFLAYAQRRLFRCNALMASPEFEMHLKAVIQGPLV